VYDQIAANKVRSAALIVVFVALVALVGYVFGRATGWGYAGLVLALVVAVVMAWGSYWYSDRIVLTIRVPGRWTGTSSRISSTPSRGSRSRPGSRCPRPT
jgi:Zn-dependent protease with chaperone function